jgi:peptidoglycan hydrolase-like protein with peptidoglycan-binding domain
VQPRRGSRSNASTRRSPLLLGLRIVSLAIILAGVGLAAVAFFWPRAEIAADAQALARVKLSPVGERLSTVSVTDGTGRTIAVTVRAGQLWPVGKVASGAHLTVTAIVRRASWVGWLIGRTEGEKAVVETPRTRIAATVLHPASGTNVSIRFGSPVSVVTLSRTGAKPRQLSFGMPRAVITTGVRAAGANRVGSVVVTAAARPWETMSPPVRISWFPPTATVQTLVRPAPGTQLAPTGPIELTFSEPVAAVLGAVRPKVFPKIAGQWDELDSNTLVFQPSGTGFGLGAHVEVILPTRVSVAKGTQTRLTRTLSWAVPAGLTLRLQQLLAQLGYLPLSWEPLRSDVANTAAAQTTAAFEPPAGKFNWRYANTPDALKALWVPQDWTVITEGAVMAFEHDQGLKVDGLAGPQVWRSLIEARLKGTTSTSGYSYVLVNRTVPQTLRLWHNGATIVTARVNTGVPAAPTPYGTHPVFLHIASATMSGNNPDGSHYSDPGIRWISYFHGGEAIHGFNRATYGFPQSVGCVEAPISVAARVWPYTPIGTLVSIMP